MKLRWARDHQARTKARADGCDRIRWAERKREEYIVTALRAGGWRAV
ncbi:MAG: hypothetical protein ACRDJI_01250 [Actinomycetota bacterium]